MAFEYGDYPAHVSAAERRERIAAAVRELERRGLAPQPVEIAERRIATTVWGRAWCAHVEGLADLATRLPRGRSYVRSGAVVDLRIAPGSVRARVCGTELYEATVAVAPLPRARWAAVRRASFRGGSGARVLEGARAPPPRRAKLGGSPPRLTPPSEPTGRIANLVDLLAGKVPDAVMEALADPEDGIFPRSAELDLACSCPDDARLCKHLAAVLYGIGARLDHEPELLFVLRGVDPAELVAAAGDAASRMAAGGSEAAALPRAALGEIFGIELEPAGAKVSLGAAPRPRRRAPRRRPRGGRTRG